MLKFAAILATLLFVSDPLRAEEIPSPSLPGQTSTAVWANLGSAANPGLNNDSHPWPRAIPAEKLSFNKISGSGFASKSGIYAGGAEYSGPLQDKILSGKVTKNDLPNLKAEDFHNIGNFQITTDAPLSPVKTIAFQIRIKGFPPSESFSPFELTQQIFPVTLSFNQGEQKLPPSSRKLVSMKFDGGFHEEIYAVQWDLDTISEPIRDFSISWAVYPHALTTGLRVDQSDTVAPPLGSPAPR